MYIFPPFKPYFSKMALNLICACVFSIHVSLAFAEAPLDTKVKKVNADLKNMQVELLEWPASLAAELGEIKKVAFVAKHRNTRANKLPLLISLHGGGGKNWTLAEQLERSANVKGLALVEKANRDLMLFAPNSSDSWDPATLDRALDYFLKKHPQVDKKRIYLLGHSMGGTGTLRWALANPERFAAISPSGFRLRSELDSLDALIPLPIWLMVGAEDGVRPTDVSALASDLQKAGHKQVGYTAFPGANHAQANAAVFSSVDLVDWLLSHAKK